MTGKQIRTSQDEVIIDGVDVSVCEAYKPYLGKYDCIALGNKSATTCKGSPNCLFKQLARKTQECEALQMSDNEAREIVAELKAECEELKEKVKELNQGWIDCDKERNLQEANSEFRQRVINRYKRTLTEIKEIAEENIRISESEGLNGVYRRGLAKQILQKTSEVLDDGTK